MQHPNGKLIYQEGQRVTILHNDKPFALLHALKKEMIQKGYKKENLKIKYLFN
jgi:hypothetical protein